MKKLFIVLIVAILIISCDKNKTQVNVSVRENNLKPVSENTMNSSIQNTLNSDNLILPQSESKFFLVMEEGSILSNPPKELTNGYLEKYAIVTIDADKTKDIEYYYAETRTPTTKRWIYVSKINDSNNYGYIRDNKVLNIPFSSIDEALNYALSIDLGMENIWNLEEGYYFIHSISYQSPQFWWLKFENLTLFVKSGKIHFINLDENQVYISAWDKNEFGSFSKYFFGLSNIPNDTPVLFSVSGRSGGGETFILIKENEEIKMIKAGGNFAFIEQMTYTFGKGKRSIEITYDIDFPWYALITTCNAYSTSDVSGVPDMVIIGNQREGEYGSLSKIGEESIVQIIDIHQKNGKNIFTARYKGNIVWIKEEDIPERSCNKVCVNGHSMLTCKEGLIWPKEN